MTKCPICNGCTRDVWIGNKHFWFCDFCEKYFVIKDGKKVEVNPDEKE